MKTAERRSPPRTAPAAPSLFPETRWDRLRKKVIEFGMLRAIALETALVELCSLALTTGIMWALNERPLLPGLIIATVCVLVCGPAVGYATFKLLFELEIAHRRVLKLATTDPLTGIYNRRHFMLMAEHEVRHAKDFGTPVSLIMVDIDHFKHINDGYGHQCGDEVLRQIAQTCQSMLRTSDVLARFGGEEMIFLLTQTDLSGACALAELLRSRIESLAIEWRGRQVRPTASVGVACLPVSTTSVDALIHDADTALYAAKRLGRNQVRHAPGAVDSPAGAASEAVMAPSAQALVAEI